MFNESQYPRLIADGMLKPQYLRNSHLKEPERVGEPPCTHAQMIRYLDTDGHWLAEVFQYVRPDQTIGASGKADPKRLRVGTTILVVEFQNGS